MKELWKSFANDFNSMTDDEIDAECDIEQSRLDGAESWLEAVASWKAAGSPRSEAS